ncbi:serine hydrolase domain-containing protein [Longirhabdus pacifica]|uniref:serine hydrolase domain-containing protein n=1 Tax=Longirhabdus pacifica TaxID=2305227 RepID=UPI0010089887|nr:serine hydrolase domain-containing protein [Longirhabdus pacifica]
MIIKTKSKFNMNIKTATIIALLCTLIFTMVHTPVTNAETDTNSELDIEQINAFVEEAMDKMQIPGAAIGIVKGDQILYTKGYGISGADETAVTAQTPFTIGSTSKSFTALAVMQLVEEGLIDLDTPVQQYLPKFKLADKKASKEITVRHLLLQTSGISRDPSHKGNESDFILEHSINDTGLSISEHIKHLDKIELAQPVGEVYQYANLNYSILGAVIEAVTDQSYEQYVEEHIFTPLEMNNSYTYRADAIENGLPTPYNTTLGPPIPIKDMNERTFKPSGLLNASAEDMTHYLIAQMNNGVYKDNRVLSEEGVEQMHAPGIEIEGTNLNYGFGWLVEDNTFTHDGGTFGFYTRLWSNGEYGIVTIQNRIDHNFLGADDLIFQGIFEIITGNPLTVEIPNLKKEYLSL